MGNAWWLMVEPLFVANFLKKPTGAVVCFIGFILLGLGVVFWPEVRKKEMALSRILYTPHETINPYQPKLKTTWPVPFYWQEQESDPMSEATFLIKKANSEALYTITKLEGPSGSLLANVNRWRSQLNLTPIQAGLWSEYFKIELREYIAIKEVSI